MQYKNTLIVYSLPFFLLGCANNTPEKPSSQVRDETVIALKSGGYVKTQGLQLLKTDYQTPSDTVLRVISKTDTTTVVAAKAASFVFTALVGGNTSQSTFSKHDLGGMKIETVENPAISYFLPKMNKIVEEKLHINDNNDYRNYPLTMKYSNFYLVYSELAGSSNYEVNYAMDISTAYPGKYKLDCSFTVGSYPLEEWSTNEFQKVKEVVKSKLDECLRDFSKENNLNLLASDLSKMKAEKEKS